MLHNIFIFFILSAFFAPVGIAVARYAEFQENKNKLTGIFLITYFVFGFYMLTCYSISIDNPLDDYISDHQMFYENPVVLSNFSSTEIIKESFTDFSYNDYPMAICVFALYLRILKYFYFFEDCGIALMMPIIFFASLIPVFMGKTLIGMNLFNAQIRNAILVFSFCSPLFYYSAYLYRDIHIYFLYTLILYFLLLKKAHFRYIYIALLIIITYYFRKENGLFCFAFICAYLCGFWLERYSKYKYIFIGITIFLGSLIFFAVIDDLMATLIFYNDRSLSEANAISFGAKIAMGIPFPFNYILLSFFSQILPFPFYHRILLCDAPWMIFPDWRLHIISCINPFYWSYVIFIIIVKWKNALLPATIRYLFYAALLYIFLTSIAEFNVRRQMVVAPLFFYVYIMLSQQLSSVKKMTYLIVSMSCLLFLHILYWTFI